MGDYNGLHGIIVCRSFLYNAGLLSRSFCILAFAEECEITVCTLFIIEVFEAAQLEYIGKVFERYLTPPLRGQYNIGYCKVRAANGR